MNKKTIIFALAIMAGVGSLIVRHRTYTQSDLQDIVDHVHLPGRTMPDRSPQQLSKNQKLVFAVYLIDFIGESKSDDLEHKKMAYQQLKKRTETGQYPPGLVELVTGIIDNKLQEIEHPESLSEQLHRALTQPDRSSAARDTDTIDDQLKRYGIDEDKLRDDVTRYIESIPTPTSPVPIWEKAANLNFSAY